MQPPTPLQALESLHKLKFDFAQSFRLLQSSTPLSHLLPNLKSLTLSSPHTALMGSELTQLPATLTALKIRSSNFNRVEAETSSISISEISLLPPHLETLDLPSITILMDEETSSYAGIRWPQSLRNLTCLAQSLVLLKHLPPLVEHLEMMVADGLEEGRLATSQLPRSLKRISLDGNLDANFLLYFDGPDSIPPFLEEWNAPLDLRDATMIEPFGLLENGHVNWTRIFPPSLTSATLSNMWDSPALFGPAYSPAGPLLRSTTLLSLPDIKTLHLDIRLPPEFFHHLPPKLEQCFIPYNSAEDIAVVALPRSIKQLQANILPEDILRLPPQLTSLHLFTPNFEPTNFPDHLIAELPRTLSRLNVCNGNFATARAFSALPTSLTELTLYITHESDSTTSDLGEHLTPSLKRLYIWIKEKATHVKWETWLANLNRLSCLDTLEVHFFDMSSVKTVSFEYLLSLPQSLQSLQTVVGQPFQNFGSQILSRLPSRLTRLQLSGKSRIDLTDDYFSNLPDSLSMLSLDHTFKGLTPRFFDVIPKGIFFLQILPLSITPPLEFRDMVKKYYRDPLWEGYGPVR
jgi:hypothetical protein